MSTTSFLTDIRIAQSKTWQRNTDHIGELYIPLLKSLAPLSINDGSSLFLNLLKIFLQRNHYDVIINGNLRTAQFLALIRRLFPLHFPQQILLELMLDETQEDFFWKIKRKIQEFVFARIELIFVSSRSEIETYSERLRLPKERICFLPFHTNVVEPKIVQGTGNYFLSAGKTGRDFQLLTEAVKDLKCELVIVSDEDSIKGIDLPSNIKLLLNIPYSKYLELLFDCRAVIVPLKRLVKSTGQVVILEAMALGKPVIATETVGTVDYIQSGFNGLLVPPDDPGCLHKAISQLLKDESFCCHLSANALKTVKEFHTFETYVNAILKAARELAT